VQEEEKRGGPAGTWKLEISRPAAQPSCRGKYAKTKRILRRIKKGVISKSHRNINTNAIATTKESPYHRRP
jgi:hypothetical protein